MKNWFSQLFAHATEQGRNAIRLALIFIVAAFLAVLIFAYVAVQTGAWQAYAATSAFIGFFIGEAFVIRFARRNRVDIAGVMLIGSVCYIVLAMVTLMGGIGLGLSIALALVIIEIVFETLTDPLATRARISGMVFAVAIFLFDQFMFWERPLIPAVQYAIPLIAAGTVITIALLMVGRLMAWKNLDLARKLLLAFGGLFVFGLIIAAVGLFGLNRVQNAYEASLSGGVEIRSLSKNLDISLLEARRREKDFLLRWKEEGFDTAYENYVVANQQHTAEMKTILKELEALSPAVGQVVLVDYSQEQYEADVAKLHEQVQVYEQAFVSTVALIEQRGFVDTGLEGQFRTAVHSIESKIYDRQGLDHLVITMLQIRRREKDYLLRGDQQYVENVHELVAQLKDQVRTARPLSANEKAEINALADEYLVKFNGLVVKDGEVADAIEVFRAAGANVQTTTQQIESVSVQLAEQDIKTAQANSAQTFALTIITVFIVLILSITLALVLSRQITNPVRMLTNVAYELESGNYDAHAEVASNDEIGTLASAFNGMARQIKETLATIAQRAAELQTVSEVSASASTLLDVDKLLWNVSNLTKQQFGLYHAHIYMLNEAGDTLVLAAGAGEAGRQMVSEGRRIPLDREQSLVARAARERKGVIVNDVRAAPDFLPHPLLPDTRSELAVPMIVSDKVVGVFDVQSDVENQFTEENANIQSIMAAQIAVAVQNARSYAEVQTKAERESLIASIGQKIQNTSTVESALQVAVRELGRVVGQETLVRLSTSQNGS